MIPYVNVPLQNAVIDHETMETTKKIDLEVASLKTLLESLKLETIRYLAGSVCVCVRLYAKSNVICHMLRTQQV